MKTNFFIILLLLLPLSAFGQASPLDPNLYPKIILGEKWIARGIPDSALALTERWAAQPNLSAAEQRQVLFLRARTNFELSLPDTALIDFQRCARLAKSNKDQPLLLWSQLGLVATNAQVSGAEENPEIDSLLEEAQELAEKIRDTAAMARCFSYTASMANMKGDIKEALGQIERCETLLGHSTAFDYERAINLNNKGVNLMDQYILHSESMEPYIQSENNARLQSAQQCFVGAVEIFSRLNEKVKEAHSRNSAAASFLYSEELDKATRQVQQSIRLGIDLQNEEILVNGYHTLASLQEMKGDKPGAIESLQKLKGLITRRGDSGEAAFLRDQFSNNDGRVSAALINGHIGIYTSQLEAERISERNQWIWSAAAIFILLLGAYLVYSRQRNRVLRGEMDNLLKSQELEFLRARFEGEEEGRHRIARLIHDQVGGLLVSAKWNLESALDELSKKETRVAARLNENLHLQEISYRELRRVVHELERDDTLWWEDLQNFYRQVAEHHETKIRFFTYNLDQRVGGSVGEEARLIVQEIITNALKYAKASTIDVQINQIDGVLGIIVEDDGVGFSMENVKKGVGLRSIEQRCAQLGAELSIEADQNKGTAFFIDIPLQKHDILKENPLLYAGAN